MLTCGRPPPNVTLPMRSIDAGRSNGDASTRVAVTTTWGSFATPAQRSAPSAIQNQEGRHCHSESLPIDRPERLRANRHDLMQHRHVKRSPINQPELDLHLSLILYIWIFPVSVIGSPVTKRMCRGILWRPICPSQSAPQMLAGAHDHPGAQLFAALRVGHADRMMGSASIRSKGCGDMA